MPVAVTAACSMCQHTVTPFSARKQQTRSLQTDLSCLITSWPTSGHDAVCTGPHIHNEHQYHLIPTQVSLPAHLHSVRNHTSAAVHLPSLPYTSTYQAVAGQTPAIPARGGQPLGQPQKHPIFYQTQMADGKHSPAPLEHLPDTQRPRGGGQGNATPPLTTHPHTSGHGLGYPCLCATLTRPHITSSLHTRGRLDVPTRAVHPPPPLKIYCTTALVGFPPPPLSTPSWSLPLPFALPHCRRLAGTSLTSGQRPSVPPGQPMQAAHPPC
jgi:hypothetical protein